MKINVAGKVIVITGSSRGLGKEIALKFAEEKAFWIKLNIYLVKLRRKQNVFFFKLMLQTGMM